MMLRSSYGHKLELNKTKLIGEVVICVCISYYFIIHTIVVKPITIIVNVAKRR